MKITSVAVTPLNLIPVIPLTISYGSFDVLEYVLVTITADNGMIGYGEGAADTEVTGETQDSMIAGLTPLTDELVGRDPMDIEAIMGMLTERLPSSPTAWAAVDMALYDLMGKGLSLPAYKLLGGKVRSEIAFYPTIPMDAPDVMAGYADGMYKGGFRKAKIKLGTTIDEDVERVKKIMEVAPDMVLAPDINQGWVDADTALKALERLKDAPLSWVEQPVKADDLESLVEVTRHSPFPIMVDEGCHGPEDALVIAARKAADIINIKLMKAGGLYRGAKLASVAEAAGIPVSVGSMFESSLGSAAGMHLTAAKAGVIACESIGPPFLKNDIGTGLVIDFEKMIVRVPEGPGLGIEVTDLP
jgi:L-alanine-DL-glutamate epimerase-like enolase superfamily enzyme